MYPVGYWAYCSNWTVSHNLVFKQCPKSPTEAVCENAFTLWWNKRKQDCNTRMQVNFQFCYIHMICFYITWHHLTDATKILLDRNAFAIAVLCGRIACMLIFLECIYYFYPLRPSDSYMRQLTIHCCYRKWLVAYSTSSYYRDQCWNIVNETIKNKLQRNINRK